MRRALVRVASALLAYLSLAWAPPASAEDVVADLSSHIIAINTGFTGASVVLFGAIEGSGDIVVAVRGPDREMAVWRKGKVAGIWVNAESVTFHNVPTFYAVASSRPLDSILAPASAALHRIGEPVEVSGAIVFLASPAASLITGHTILIDGGWTAR